MFDDRATPGLAALARNDSLDAHCPGRASGRGCFDELCEWNRGRLHLALAGGRATVEPGGSGGLKIGVRALAPLFTGHLGPRALAQLGWLEASERELSRAEAIFAGPAPWMADSF